MAVGSVSQREIVEVPYQLPDGSIKPHMALVLSTEKLLYAEDGMFYAVKISIRSLRWKLRTNGLASHFPSNRSL